MFVTEVRRFLTSRGRRILNSGGNVFHSFTIGETILRQRVSSGQGSK